MKTTHDFADGESDGRMYRRIPDEEDGKISCVANEISSTSILIGRQKGNVSVYNDVTVENRQLQHVSRQGGNLGPVQGILKGEVSL